MWQNMPYGYIDGSWAHAGHWPGLGLHGLFWLLLAAILATMVVWAVRGAKRYHCTIPAGKGPDALEILDGRYARGEIDREDYLARRQDLEARA